jgi:hypothetical protein
MNDAIVVEFFARDGIFSKELLIQIKVNLEPIARAIARINLQSKINLRRFLGVIGPEIKLRSPVKTIDNAVKRLYKRVNKRTCNKKNSFREKNNKPKIMV